MALYKNFKFGSYGMVGVWKITESLQELESSIALSEEEMALYRQFRFDARKREWLAVRCLLHQMLGYYAPVHYLPSGKPWIDGCHNRTHHSLSTTTGDTKFLLRIYLDTRKMLNLFG